MLIEQRHSTRRRLIFVLLASALSGLCAFALRPNRLHQDPTAPGTHQSEGYVGAAECKSCHPGAYDSWSHTYHKSMTRPASILVDRELDRLPQLPVSLQADDRSFELLIAGGQVVVQGPDLHEIGQQLAQIIATSETSHTWRAQKAKQAWLNAKLVTRNIVLVTGSHHYLALWVAGERGAALRQLPFVFLLDEQRWIPRKEAFLQPPDALPHIARFNANCIQCHTVAGRPRQSEGNDEFSGEFWEQYESDVVDLGIACEACHGPGRNHAQSFKSPFARFLARYGKHNPLAAKENAPSTHIFLPKADNPETTSAACGQCHSYFLPNDPDSWWSSGFTQNYKAGSDLSSSRQVLRSPNSEEVNDQEHESSPKLSVATEDLFWQNGSIMVGGREYNGLLESPCYQRGSGTRKMSCVSCHSMHSGEPTDQISPQFMEKNSNKMCTQCHSTTSEKHARHRSDSPGALCINCHMPKTSYALLSGIRSHHITSPSQLPSQSTARDAPSACALCHTDRDAHWLETKVAEFSMGVTQATTSGGAPSPGQETRVPWAIEKAMTGHAAMRAILLSALASPEALKTAGREPFDLVVDELLKDEYAAIKHMARRAQPYVERSAPLLTPTARANISVSRDELRELRKARDHRPMVISE